jgi:hypothetical protein
VFIVNNTCDKNTLRGASLIIIGRGSVEHKPLHHVKVPSLAGG